MCVLRRAGRPGGNEGRSNVHPREPRAFRYMMGIQAAGVVCRPFLCRDAIARRGRIEGEHSAVPVAWFPSKSERSVAMDESSPCVTSRSDHRCASLFCLILLLIFSSGRVSTADCAGFCGLRGLRKTPERRFLMERRWIRFNFPFAAHPVILSVNALHWPVWRPVRRKKNFVSLSSPPKTLYPPTFLPIVAPCP
jgi:hypothetical protein